MTSEQSGAVRAIFEGFSMSFLTQLDTESYSIIARLCRDSILAGQELQKRKGEAPPGSVDIYGTVLFPF
jgi:midasin (ATPase involved in ribosome maturation)